MAAPLSADRLVRVLRDEGLEVHEYRSWRTHNRNHKGAWGPINGVMIHHTVTRGTDSSVRLCYDGYSTLPGPLCHGVIAKDGSVHLVGNGRANHAGSGDDEVMRAVVNESSSLPRDNEANTDGNSRFYGFECVNMGDGEDPWPDAQLEAIEKAAAAICREYGWSAKSVIGHLEWQPGKIDPRGFGMDWMRNRIEDRLSRSPENQQEEDHMAGVSDEQWYENTWRHDGVMRSAWGIGTPNEHWMPESVVEHIGYGVHSIEGQMPKLIAQVEALSETVKVLAAREQVDGDAILEMIRQKIDSIEVDLVVHDPTATQG